MTKFTIPSVTERLNHPGNPLYGLVMQAKFLDARGKALAKRLGLPLNRHCRLARISSDTVFLQVDSSVWYSKVRFLEPDIVTFFQTECGMPTVARVRIHVNPPLPCHGEPARGRPRLSSNVGEILRGVAAITENEALRQAWLRLARDV
uniref:DUF721 domain-containing protein n=1 Tax=Candidatus Kentrum sp. SD TaxID=2126332 RepID=A0A450YRD1_9GAMM|nr:MAG: hypothetical protein BECKSD772F_GA0070984_103518 [Candidatus Kentron sp. SD]VFK44110.1 MAG: hypothetical protein BECKSD772E_GA0070983_103318 [Candidatus Kentron sp. SD]